MYSSKHNESKQTRGWDGMHRAKSLSEVASPSRTYTWKKVSAPTECEAEAFDKYNEQLCYPTGEEPGAAYTTLFSGKQKRGKQGRKVSFNDEVEAFPHIPYVSTGKEPESVDGKLGKYVDVSSTPRGGDAFAEEQYARMDARTEKRLKLAKEHAITNGGDLGPPTSAPSKKQHAIPDARIERRYVPFANHAQKSSADLGPSTSANPQLNRQSSQQFRPSTSASSRLDRQPSQQFRPPTSASSRLDRQPSQQFRPSTSASSRLDRQPSQQFRPSTSASSRLDRQPSQQFGPSTIASSRVNRRLSQQFDFKLPF